MGLEPRIRPAFSCLADTSTVATVLGNLVMGGMRVDGTTRRGYLSIYDGDRVCYMALRKGKGQPWIVSGWNTENVKWGDAGRDA